MAEEHLGPVFEIHGGGLDLVFPHHENELAQSRALGHEFARIWTHNGMLEFVGEKMSKSVGNVITLRDGVETWGRETTLLFMMTGHWRSPIDLSDETLAAAKAQWTTFLNAFLMRDAPGIPGPAWGEFEAILDDDFNMPDALAVMHEWRRTGQYTLLERALKLFGLIAESAKPPEDVLALAQSRQDARARRDFDEADRLRAEIEARGWSVRDVADGHRLAPKQ